MDKDPIQGYSVVIDEGPVSVAAAAMTLAFLLWLSVVESWRPRTWDLQVLLVSTVAVGQLSLLLLMRWSWRRNRVAGLLAIAGFLVGGNMVVWLPGGHWLVVALSVTLGALVGYLAGLLFEGRIIRFGEEAARPEAPVNAGNGVAEVAGILGELAARRFAPNASQVVGFGVSKLAGLATQRVTEWNESRQRKRLAVCTFWETCRTWMILATVLLTAQTAMLQPSIQGFLGLPSPRLGHVSLWFAILFWVGMVLAALSRSTVQDGTGVFIGKEPRRTKRPALIFVGFGLPLTAAFLAWLSP